MRLTDYAVQSLGVENSILTQDLNSSSWLTPWSASSATPDPSFLTFTDGAQGLRLSNGNWLENWGQGYTLTASSMNAVSTTWLATYRLRSTDTDMIGIAPLWSNATGRLISVQYADLRPEWDEFSFVVDMPNSSSMVVANILSNVHWGTGPAFTNTSTIDLDLTRFEPCTLVADHYATEVLPNHRLFFHCPLPGVENDPLNVASSGGNLTIPGNIGQCWSDVFGNFYAAGDQIPLDEWASIVLFRMDVAPANLALDGNGEHHITANTVWTDNMNVEGRVVVPNGATLTIDGAHIGFAESTSTLTTNITVEPGGTLILRNGATLRNWMGCGSAPTMWDGVKVLGNGTTAGAGLVRMESGARITDAYVAMLSAETDPFLPQANDVSGTGGIVQAENAQFLNNRFDIWMNEHTGFDPLVNGPSSFVNCSFTTSRPLAHPTSTNPLTHVTLRSAQSIAFPRLLPTRTSHQNNPLSWGQGLVAYDTRVQVVPNEAGDRPRFDRLFMAVNHASWNPSRTAMVDRADFTRCHRGFYSVATDNLRLTNCTPSTCPRTPPTPTAHTYTAARASSSMRTSSWTSATRAWNAEVGAHFSHSGTESHLFYNNTFTGSSTATSSSGYSAVTIISRS